MGHDRTRPSRPGDLGLRNGEVNNARIPTSAYCWTPLLSGSRVGHGTRSTRSRRSAEQSLAESPAAVWNDVVDLHSLVLGWHDDHDGFDKIGYLVSTGSSLGDFVGPGA